MALRDNGFAVHGGAIWIPAVAVRGVTHRSAGRRGQLLNGRVAIVGILGHSLGDDRIESRRYVGCRRSWVAAAGCAGDGRSSPASPMSLTNGGRPSGTRAARKSMRTRPRGNGFSRRRRWPPAPCRPRCRWFRRPWSAWGRRKRERSRSRSGRRSRWRTTRMLEGFTSRWTRPTSWAACNCARHLSDDRHRTPRRQGTFSFDQRAQVRAVDQSHVQKEPTVHVAEVVDRDDVRLGQLRHRLALPPEPFARLARRRRSVRATPSARPPGWSASRAPATPGPCHPRPAVTAARSVRSSRRVLRRRWLARRRRGPRLQWRRRPL